MEPKTAALVRQGATARLLVTTVLIAGAVVVAVGWMFNQGIRELPKPIPGVQSEFKPRQTAEDSGYELINELVKPWKPNASLEQIRDSFLRLAYRSIEDLDHDLEHLPLTQSQRIDMLSIKAVLLNYEGEPARAYDVLQKCRAEMMSDTSLAHDTLYSVIYLQGVTALRRAENDNCILCRGESSCILPISPAAIHIHPEGSRLAIQHFTEYLDQFPEDLEVRWLLNVAHMTLGEYPDQVEPRYVVSIQHFLKSEFDIGKFRDIGDKIGVNHFNQAGGAIMDDFDNDGRLDLVTTTFDPTSSMNLFRNSGTGTFDNRTVAAGLSHQFGGLNCVQTDFNNDGYLDIFVVRGAWLNHPIRPSLLKNNQDGTFTDVTEAAGLMYPANSIAASWADYDNDGWLDLFVCCEQQPSRLYRNRGDNTFENVTGKAGVFSYLNDCKGVAWIDFDNDGYQDLFLNYLIIRKEAQLFRNKRDGTFESVTKSQGIDGPSAGFSCWAWDFDNDGWLDIFASCYRRTLGDVVHGLQGQPHEKPISCLYRNRNGTKFEDVTQAAGLDGVYSTMGSNFADFDNDGFLDMYLGTGEPSLAALVPNRMFKNVGGKRFSDITVSSGTGHLQKGHGVACGDWDRDGNVDLFIEMGGAVNGDKYHNVLFQNPGHKAHSLTVKLIGKQTNRAAIGARIKIVTAGPHSQTIHRHVSSGSSFGANPLQQTIGLAQADRIELLEIHWPTSGSTQGFKDLAADQAIEIEEFATHFRKLNWTPIPVPK